MGVQFFSRDGNVRFRDPNTLYAGAFTVVSFPSEVSVNTGFNIVVDGSTEVPTTLNVEVRWGSPTGPLATNNSVSGAGPYTINAVFGQATNIKFDRNTGYRLFVKIGTETVLISTPSTYIPALGRTYIDALNVDTSEGSVGHLWVNVEPVDGGQFVYATTPSPNPDGLTCAVLETGEIYISGQPSVTCVMPVYYVHTDGAVYDEILVTFNVDSAIPVITLSGGANVTHPHNAPWVDPGYTATDDTDGDITANVVVGGTVNPNATGVYNLTYDVTDSSGNPAVQQTRTVTVADQTAPTLVLNGNATIDLALGQSYTEFEAQASDLVDGNLTPFIVIGGTVDTNTPGTYQITYDVSDAAGNAATQLVRTVNVSADTGAPVITLIGSAIVRHPIGTPYNDAGATANDAIDGDLSASIVTTGASIDVDTVGFYTVRYNVTDSGGNPAIEVTRSVEVYTPDVVAPSTLSPTSIYVHAALFARRTPEPFPIYIDNLRNATVDFENVAIETETTLVSATFEVEEGDSITFGTQIQVGDIVQIDIDSGSNSGQSLIRCTGTLSNGEQISAYLIIDVIDPSL